VDIAPKPNPELVAAAPDSPAGGQATSPNAGPPDGPRADGETFRRFPRTRVLSASTELPASMTEDLREQYAADDNLRARIALHAAFSINPHWASCRAGVARSSQDHVSFAMQVGRQASARSSAARSVGAPCVGRTSWTGSASSARRPSATCSRVTPSRSHSAGISSPRPKSTSVSPEMTAPTLLIQRTRSFDSLPGNASKSDGNRIARRVQVPLAAAPG
jgi:hypothetical protein